MRIRIADRSTKVDAYRAALAGADITASMSRTGNCYDNAVTESFFGTREQVNVWTVCLSRLVGRPGKPSSSTSNASTTAFDGTLHSAISVRLLMSNRCVNPNVSGFHKSGSTSFLTLYLTLPVYDESSSDNGCPLITQKTVLGEQTF